MTEKQVLRVTVGLCECDSVHLIVSDARTDDEVAHVMLPREAAFALAQELAQSVKQLAARDLMRTTAGSA